MDFEKCTIMSGFRRSSHIWDINYFVSKYAGGRDNAQRFADKFQL